MLVTAGNTLTPIDAVRGITNLFSGRTGARIAAEATLEGYDVELLTSKPDVIDDTVVDYSRLELSEYRTFDDLAEILEGRVRNGGFDVIVHAAAISDYRCTAVYETPGKSTPGDAGSIAVLPETSFTRVDASTKISSGHNDLWIRLAPTPKLIDQIRSPWGFTGVLVKFKLEVGVSEAELARRAADARLQSEADFVVANSFESMHDRAFIIDGASVESVERPRLPSRLLARIADLRSRKAASPNT